MTNSQTDTSEKDSVNSAVLSAQQSGQLCQACGVCCTGAFFSHVNITDKEVERLKDTPIKTYIGKKDKPVFDQPCPALSGTSCSIYDKRPGSCRAYLCILTRNVLTGHTDYEAALDSVSELKALTAWLHANAPAQAPEPGNTAPAQKQQTPENILAAWQSGAAAVPIKKALWVMLTNLHIYFSKKQDQSMLSEQDVEYISKAFAFAKLCDREFAPTPLLRKYAQLVQRF